jgi:glutamyl-tRNA synthetase
MTVRVRFAPSPTGDIHVGNIRTALFNWAYARHEGGTFVFRVEDTDVERSTEASYRGVVDALNWLGLTWDEGPDVGGPYAPYKQSERGAIYADVAAKLAASPHAYNCYCTTEEVEARNKLSGRQPGYDNHCRSLTQAQVAAFLALGRKPALRLRMPDRAITFDDLIRGPVTFEPEFVPDYVLVRADGNPLYTLVNPVDDALMRITHVLRGEDLLSSTPRQIALYEALGSIGVTDGQMPLFGHLPFVMGEGNKKLSKRDPESSLMLYRERGFLPEALLNYLALVGWSMGEDRELFSLQEMVDAFSLERVSRNPARFDLKKCEAINGVKIRELAPDEAAIRILPFLQNVGMIANPPTSDQLRLLAGGAPLVQERITVLSEAVGMLGFLFVDDGAFEPDAEASAKNLNTAAAPAIVAAVASLEPLEHWHADDIKGALEAALIGELGLKPRNAYAPLRVAITGRTVSPPLFESMELLGRERSMARLRRAAASVREDQ